MIEIRWHGRGGQGSFTASRILGHAVTIHGDLFALAFPSFGPERRGAPVLAFNKIDSSKISDRSIVTQCDYIVVLDESLFQQAFLGDLKDGGAIIVNSAKPDAYEKYADGVITLDATTLALEALGRPVANTAMLGALAGVSGLLTPQAIADSLSAFFSGSALHKNVGLVQKAWRAVKAGAQ